MTTTYGISAFRKIQIGTESPAGTKVDASARLLGQLTMEELMTLHRPVDQIGVLMENHRTVIAGEAVELGFDGDATFEQILYFLHMALLTGSKTGPTDTTAYTWTYDPSDDSANTPTTFTLEYGDNAQEHEVEYAGIEELTISGAMHEPWKVKAKMFARNLAASSFTNSIALPTVEAILTNKTQLYIDSTGAGLGGTEVASHLVDFSLKISGFKPVKHGGTTLFFTSLAEPPKKITLDMNLVFSSVLEAERLLYVAGTKRFVQLKATGSLAGSASAYKTATISFCGVYTKFGSLGDKDGETVVPVTIEAEYDTTWSKLITAVIVNKVATLP
ncbi:MAG: hypothetical protein PHQ43_00180 [Dehalococcoidales bacterium]|nr:hypothetical protein [Dehalococcoidales bacterium]